MTKPDVEVPRVPDRRIPAGWSPPYDPPFGKMAGLPERIASWVKRLSSPALPWVGLGLIRDLEMVMRILNLREFGEFLRSRAGIDSEWGDEIIEAADAADDLAELDEKLAEAVHEQTTTDYDDPLDAIEDIKRQAAVARQMRAMLGETDPASVLRAFLDIKRQAAVARQMRAALVETGALADDDMSTDPAALLRALLA